MTGALAHVAVALPSVILSALAGVVCELIARLLRKAVVKGALDVKLSRAQCVALAVPLVALNAAVTYVLIGLRGGGTRADLTTIEVSGAVFFYIQPTLWEVIAGTLGEPGTSTDVVY